ncbi:MAG: multiple antibiotic resistance protein [Thermoproteota archaeon]|nr:multiple antibiotic resistance protein [Thermoproteota archaeon]
MFEDLTLLIMTFLPELVKGIIALFIVVDPLGNIPIFVSLTDKTNLQQRRKIFNTATIVGLILLLSFTLAGQQILLLFGITLHSFQIAGGILLLIIAIRFLILNNWQEQPESFETVGAVPIGCPLLVGPGAITTTILSLQTSGVVIAVLSVIITFSFVGLILRFIDPVHKFLGKTGSLVISKLMALFIASIAIQYILEGLRIG